jgi:peptide/nickel transport system permease protein
MSDTQENGPILGTLAIGENALTLPGDELQRGKIQFLFSNRSLGIGFSISALIVVIAAIGPLAIPYAPTEMDYLHRLAPPGMQHLFGTDNYGRDLLSRVVSGARLSLLIGASVAAINVIFGTALGVVAAYYKKMSNPIMRLMDALMSFPAVLLALAITAALGSRIENVIIALAIVYTPRSARVVRAAVLTVRNAIYVEAARVANASDWWIITRQISSRKARTSWWKHHGSWHFPESL